MFKDETGKNYLHLRFSETSLHSRTSDITGTQDGLSSTELIIYWWRQTWIYFMIWCPSSSCQPSEPKRQARFYLTEANYMYVSK